MNWEFNDIENATPAKPGTYIWWHKDMGQQIPIYWTGSNWEWLNGRPMPDKLVRWWK